MQNEWSMKSYKIDPMKTYGIEYPALCTPKIIGPGCRTIEGGTPQYNTGQLVDNDYVTDVLEMYGVAGLDGVLNVDPKNDLLFTYAVFDKWDEDGDYSERMEALNNTPLARPPQIEIIQPALITDREGFLNYVTACYAKGYEGVMAKPTGYEYIGAGPISPITLYEYSNKETREARIEGYDGHVYAQDKVSLSQLHGVDTGSGEKFTLKRGWTDKQRNILWINRQIFRGKNFGYSCCLVEDKVDYNTAKFIGMV